MNLPLARRAVAEFLGTGFLVAAVVGSGIMGARLAAGNVALALLANTIATGAALAALILALAPLSGAHLNPVVSLVDTLEGGLPPREMLPYVLSQALGAISGAVLAHLMFGLPLIFFSTQVRSGPAQVLSEFVATFGLILVIRSVSRQSTSAVAAAVGAYISAAYWFTASTSFANPAVTIARAFSDTFAGIRPKDVPWFVLAEFAGGIAATLLFRWLAPAARARVPAASSVQEASDLAR